MNVEVISIDYTRLATFRWRYYQARNLLPPVKSWPGVQPGKDGHPSTPVDVNIGDAAWGCLLSHHEIWRKMSDTTLIFEDDAVLVDMFEMRLAELMPALPDDWDVLYLGGEHAIPPEPVNALLGRVRRTHRTHAYVVRHDSRHTLLDTTYGRRCHIDSAMIQALQDGLVAYAPTGPWLAGQAAGYSSITQQHEHERWWQD